MVARMRTRLTPHQQVTRVYELCLGDPTALPPELVAASAALVEQRAAVAGLDTAFLAAARSTLHTATRRARYLATMRAVRAPVLLLHGEADRLVSVRSARAAAARNPSWELHTFPRVGHVPQLEVPDLAAARILDWLARSRERRMVL
jgi:pimeloyl-ACP methyl ester carboxylesterase